MTRLLWQNRKMTDPTIVPPSVGDWVERGGGDVDCGTAGGGSFLLASVERAELTSATTFSKARTQSIATNGHSSLVPSIK